MPVRNLVTPCIAAALLVFSFTAQADDADEQRRQVAASGKASVMAQPDIARLNMTVIERNESLGAAQQAVSATTGKVLGVLDDLGVMRKHIDTTGVIIRPNYRWNRAAEEQELTGYIVERRIMVELRDMEKLGTVIERAVQAGVNQMAPPLFDHTERSSLHRQALAAAVKDARANAMAMAEAAAANLGPVISIGGAGPAAPQPRPLMRTMAADAMGEGATESYVPTDIRFEARVNIVYELTP